METYVPRSLEDYRARKQLQKSSSNSKQTATAPVVDPNTLQLLDKQGKRKDGRLPHEVRPMCKLSMWLIYNNFHAVAMANQQIQNKQNAVLPPALSHVKLPPLLLFLFFLCIYNIFFYCCNSFRIWSD
jgi:hypothetical protein